MDFDLTNKTVSFVAKRGSGKSVLIRYLITKYKHNFSKIILICPTERINHFFTKGDDPLIDPRYCFDEWDEAYVEKLCKKLT